MADRQSASLFCTFFEYLAAAPDERAKEFAKELWRMSQEYDFNEYQMYCDDALVTLGLASKRDDGAVEYAEPYP